jgi:hypothetical protein
MIQLAASLPKPPNVFWKVIWLKTKEECRNKTHTSSFLVRFAAMSTLNRIGELRLLLVSCCALLEFQKFPLAFKQK